MNNIGLETELLVMVVNADSFRQRLNSGKATNKRFEIALIHYHNKGQVCTVFPPKTSNLLYHPDRKKGIRICHKHFNDYVVTEILTLLFNLLVFAINLFIRVPASLKACLPMFPVLIFAIQIPLMKSVLLSYILTRLWK